jgi:phosphonate transport system substrate-binding protein
MSTALNGIARALRSLAWGLTALGLAFLAGVALQPSTCLAADQAPLRIVFIAYQNPDQLIEDVGPVIEYLEHTLGREVEHFAATDYAAVVEALRAERADVGFMGPLQYVLAHQEAGAYPILGEVYRGEPTYVSRIFVRKDSGIESLAELRGKTIAFTDPLSSSGYMYPLNVFKDEGLIRKREDADRFFKRVYFAGGDEQALRAVFNGFVDAAGIGQYSFSLLRPDERDAIKALGESQKIPSHCVVVRRGLPPAEVSALQKALLALNDGAGRALLKHLYSVDGYVPVTHETYLEVARLAREYGFLKQ